MGNCLNKGAESGSIRPLITMISPLFRTTLALTLVLGLTSAGLVSAGPKKAGKADKVKQDKVKHTAPVENIFTNGEALRIQIEIPEQAIALLRRSGRAAFGRGIQEKRPTVDCTVRE